VDKVTSLEKAQTAEYFSLRPSFSHEQTAFVRSFDVVITYLYDPSGEVVANLRLAGPSR